MKTIECLNSELIELKNEVKTLTDYVKGRNTEFHCIVVYGIAGDSIGTTYIVDVIVEITLNTPRSIFDAIVLTLVSKTKEIFGRDTTPSQIGIKSITRTN